MISRMLLPSACSIRSSVRQELYLCLLVSAEFFLSCFLILPLHYQQSQWILLLFQGLIFLRRISPKIWIVKFDYSVKLPASFVLPVLWPRLQDVLPEMQMVRLSGTVIRFRMLGQRRLRKRKDVVLSRKPITRNITGFLRQLGNRLRNRFILSERSMRRDLRVVSWQRNRRRGWFVDWLRRGTRRLRHWILIRLLCFVIRSLSWRQL